LFLPAPVLLGQHGAITLQITERKHTMQTEEQFDKLPVIYWKEILQETPKNHYNMRPARMHNTLSLVNARWWIEKLLGIPREKIQFVGVNEQDIETMTVADLQDDEAKKLRASDAYTKPKQRDI
jgi:hypothetical protein